MIFEAYFDKHFQSICRKYRLKLEMLSHDVVALIGDRFILSFLASIRDKDVLVTYIAKDENGEFVKWDIDQYIVEEIIEEDYAGCDQEETPNGIIRETIEILSRVLERRFGNLLSGGMAWMVEYLNSEHAERLHIWQEERLCAERYL